MNRIYKYVQKGQGFGILFLLALTVIVTFMSSIYIRHLFSEAQTYILPVVEEFLPITVENGKVIDPVNEYRSTRIKILPKSDENFEIVLDTRDNAKFDNELPVGLYIFSDAFYLVTGEKTEKVKLKDGFWDVEKYKKYLDDNFGQMMGMVAVILFCVFFIIFILHFLLIGGGIVLLKNLLKFDGYTDDQIFRLSSLMVVLVELVSYVLMFVFSFKIGFLGCLLLEFFGVFFILKRKLLINL